MLILNKNSMTPTGGRIRPSALKITLSERSSQLVPTAIVSQGNDVPQVGTWIQSEEGPAAGMVLRIKNIEDSKGAGTFSFTAEHAINVLKDTVLFGEVKAGDMAGNSSAENCTAKQAFQYILSKQSVWQLGSFAYNVSNPYNFNGENLFTALETVTGSLEDAYWDYDFSVFPFVLNVLRLSDDVDSEMRLNRNITGPVKITIDRSQMYTVIYPVGKNNMKLPERKLTKNTGAWGWIEHTETDQSKKTEAELRTWAQERLNNHCEPTVTVQVPGLYLADATGENLDRIRLNRVCRVPLPKYGTTIAEKVTELTWQDWIKEPEVVTVKLCNNQNDVQSIIKQIQSSSRRKSAADAVKAEEDHAWFEDTTDHVAMVAEAIIGRSPDGIDWTRVSSIIVDGEGIHQRVEKHEGDIVTAFTAIEANEEAIRLEAVARGEGDNELSSRITVTASQIRSEVSDTKNSLQSSITQTASQIRGEVRDSVNGLNASITATASQIRSEVSDTKNSLQSSITQTASQIRGEVRDSVNGLNASITATASQIRSEVSDTKNSLQSSITTQANRIDLVVEGTGTNAKIKPASIVTAINNSGSSVTISANKIMLDGNVTVDGMMKIDSGGGLYIKTDLVIASAGKISTKKIAMQDNGSISFPDPGGNVGTMTLNNSNIANFFTALKVVASGNGYKLQYKSMSEADWTDLPDSTFSRAVSSWVWGGGSGKINVTALPQNQTKSINVSIDGQNTITTNGDYTYTVDYENGDGDDVSTGATKTVTVNVPAEAHTNHISITRASWHSTSGQVYKGKLYYWDDDDQDYNPVVNSNKYWYYSDSSKSGTTTVWY